MGTLDDETIAAIPVRGAIEAFTGVPYAELRCVYCGHKFGGPSMEEMKADGPIALAGAAGACPVACKACYEKRHTNI